MNFERLNTAGLKKAALGWGRPWVRRREGGLSLEFPSDADHPDQPRPEQEQGGGFGDGGRYGTNSPGIKGVVAVVLIFIKPCRKPHKLACVMNGI